MMSIIPGDTLVLRYVVGHINARSPDV